jgi:hypothetical protein
MAGLDSRRSVAHSGRVGYASDPQNFRFAVFANGWLQHGEPVFSLPTRFRLPSPCAKVTMIFSAGNRFAGHGRAVNEAIRNPASSPKEAASSSTTSSP